MARRRTNRLIRTSAQLIEELLGHYHVFDDPDAKELDLANTPDRIVKAWRELLAGYRIDDDQLVAQVRLFPARGRQELVVQTGISFTSLCAHHMLPFHGTATIGYLPGTKLIGLSKFARIVDHYGARLQIQERLGAQIATFIHEKCDARYAAVLLHAEHQCMTCRGVRRPGAITTTSSIRPTNVDRELLNEFYFLAEQARGR